LAELELLALNHARKTSTRSWGNCELDRVLARVAVRQRLGRNNKGGGEEFLYHTMEPRWEKECHGRQRLWRSAPMVGS
jgi:hypothetical protein